MTQTAKLTASDGAADDAFGDSVSISGNTVVVGAPMPNRRQRRPGSGLRVRDAASTADRARVRLDLEQA